MAKKETEEPEEQEVPTYCELIDARGNQSYEKPYGEKFDLAHVGSLLEGDPMIAGNVKDGRLILVHKDNRTLGLPINRVVNSIFAQRVVRNEDGEKSESFIFGKAFICHPDMLNEDFQKHLGL